MSTRKRTTDTTRLHRAIDRLSTPDGCWPWTGKPARDGRGQMSLGNRQDGTFRMINPARFALEVRLGTSLPTESQALHTCDNPLCCRTEPEGWYLLQGVARRCYGHLFVGTTQDNTADRHEKRRDASGQRNGSITHPEALSRGAHRYNTHLTETDVQTLRLRHANGESSAQLRKDYGLGHTTFWHIIDRDNWKHVPDHPSLNQGPTILEIRAMQIILLVLAIREDYRNGMTIAAIARARHRTPTMICNIVHYKVWQDLP
jgi:hypothetical protein